MTKKYLVILTPDERDDLERMVAPNRRAARTLRRAGSNAPYRLPQPWVFRLSLIRTTFGASVCMSSASSRRTRRSPRPVSQFQPPPAQHRLEHHEQVGHPALLVLVIAPGRGTRPGRDWGPGLGNELLGHLVDGHQRQPPVERPPV
jgi:hypothetical protein